MSTAPFNAAANAYASAARLISQNSRPPTDQLASVTQGADFASFLNQSIASVEAAGARSDQLAMDMVNGRANVVDMVTAISETEIAIETMVTVRDRVISAYEEIMRMPI